ncbi:hypothetical protein ECHHL_0893 [Ehrlichia chaffeensis str. Heartland]|uniref:Uncharacterized protein n=1 Tax=Ehrlichia chaffeensis (strain ATCC CRL-10679 / Arkansas) TaxID=205920 RepID=Q2GHS8_EHRCR|nr:hypothetical protein ECH_0180 [Ehrlichia chaffeensis str. Arkansas]AHX04026.1 hypothetical protein ECHHL_0893 [Ehrlichia chaffeensis str. Heartland]AHX07963.1 hypothetical protein ECHOSC_0908 [Ehrlichia chaffeensis str. Osceola]AHX09236.1 hypothetical protein ECHWAK_0909 [Ehrlichia chaffeensis str. Wakulla]AHX10336.1 hypothetical protein ECHWP_0888 [Ehrlichia chaffeensis str. West Paces]
MNNCIISKQIYFNFNKAAALFEKKTKVKIVVVQWFAGI